MEHSTTSTAPTASAPTATAPTATAPTAAARAASNDERRANSERQARADWLITELGRLASQAEDPQERLRYRRAADSLIRLALATRP